MNSYELDGLLSSFRGMFSRLNQELEDSKDRYSELENQVILLKRTIIKEIEGKWVKVDYNKEYISYVKVLKIENFPRMSALSIQAYVNTNFILNINKEDFPFVDYSSHFGIEFEKYEIIPEIEMFRIIDRYKDRCPEIEGRFTNAISQETNV